MTSTSCFCVKQLSFPDSDGGRFRSCGALLVEGWLDAIGEPLMYDSTVMPSAASASSMVLYVFLRLND